MLKPAGTLRLCIHLTRSGDIRRPVRLGAARQTVISRPAVCPRTWLTLAPGLLPPFDAHTASLTGNSCRDSRRNGRCGPGLCSKSPFSNPCAHQARWAPARHHPDRCGQAPMAPRKMVGATTRRACRPPAAAPCTRACRPGTRRAFRPSRRRPATCAAERTAASLRAAARSA